ncbi:VraH family peptide resistance protein [Staphylococcus pseudoxylosus]|uniref:VraH family peptide resistance protein n=1 Tax=Staphylococcus pseudoxylosus TaxID=2282419 RepID=UPI002DB749FB|nr:VraH family protein [Staphylococcus pseudoxylosus]MEB7753194.1 VraH family protein [Staphylococcus pseudoxylosus]
MSLKEMWDYLLNKKWRTNDVLTIIVCMFVVSMVTTPLVGVPVGAIVYLLWFDKNYKK